MVSLMLIMIATAIDGLEYTRRGWSSDREYSQASTPLTADRHEIVMVKMWQIVKPGRYLWSEPDTCMIP